MALAPGGGVELPAAGGWGTRSSALAEELLPPSLHGEMSAGAIADGFAGSASIFQQRSVPEFKSPPLSMPSKENSVYPSLRFCHFSTQEGCDM